MRFTLVAAVALSLVSSACKTKDEPRPAAQPAPAPAPQAAAPAAQQDAVRGTIVERIDAAQYTYLKLKTDSGEVWAAVPTTDKAAGATVSVVNVAWMQNFSSKTLNRTWDKIAFGTLDAPAAPAADPVQPKFAQEMASAQGQGQGSAMHQHPTPAAPADVGNVKVAKASGPSGRTIAEIYAGRTKLKDKPVAIRGKVVKVTNGVLGKNWLHLRDGTGEGASSDLTVASTDEASVGQTVVATGTVHVDRDLGAGYHYDVLVEDAKLKAE